MRRETRSGRQTKEWILDTACNLFNEHGTQAISTKRLAKEMGISPGNLYYHFKNKEEIIRALLKDRMATFADEWDNQQLPPLQRFLAIINKVVLSWQDCRFFKKELVTLVEKDPELKKLYNNNKQTIIEKARPLFQELVQSGIVIPSDDPAVFESLLTISWIIAEYWLNFLELSDEPVTIENLQRGSDLIIQVWRPYLSPEALEELNRLSEEGFQTEGS